MSLQIEVEYSVSDSRAGLYRGNGSLYPNVKGCGYPPQLDCVNLFDNFGSVGQKFECYVSSAYPEVVITNLNIEQVFHLMLVHSMQSFLQIYTSLVYSILTPFGLFILSSLYLIFAYFAIYNKNSQLVNFEKIKISI